MRNNADKRADAKYKKEKTTLIGIRFYPSEQEILEFLKSKKPTATYIKELIKKDMKREE